MEERSYKIIDTTATKKIMALTQRIRAVAGGTSASKTVSILIWCIDYALTEREELISVVSDSFPHLEKGVITDFKVIMKDRGYWNDESWNESKHFYIFPTGTKIEFFSSDAGKAHGPRRDILFLNEARLLPWEQVDQLIIRTRKVVWMDWNPTNEFWFYTDMINKRLDIDFITLTYKDNEGLDEQTIREIESRKSNKTWWNVYGLGKLGSVEGLIYPNWQQIESVPLEARLLRRYLDYGYTHDPTAIGDIYKWNDCYVLDEQIYRKGMLNSDIADYLLNLDEQVPIAADSAEPKSNDELKLRGLTIIPARKGKDSVRNGINLVQQQKIFVTERSTNIWRERLNYLWMQDPLSGKFLNEPIGIWNHHMDGVRYAFETLINALPERVIEEQFDNFDRATYQQELNSTM